MTAFDPIIDAFKQIEGAMATFGAAITKSLDVMIAFNRELRWLKYIEDTGRSALSEALKPW